jgi:tetratricopeptide (TPR) repeat protein
MRPQISYPSRLFRDFRALETHDHRACVRFFDYYEKAILQLDFDEYFEVMCSYSRALFETGEYEKCILISDVIIETSVNENFTHFKGEEIFEHTLYQKAAAHFNSKDFAKAQYVLTELLRINPNEPDYRQSLTLCLRQRYAPALKPYRAIGIFLLSIAITIFAVNALVLRFFFEAQATLMQQICIVMCLFAAVLPMVGYAWHRFKVSRAVKKIVNA